MVSKIIKISIGVLFLFLAILPQFALSQDEMEEETSSRKKKKTKVDDTEKDFRRLVRTGDKKYYNREMVRAAQIYREAFNVNPEDFDLSYRLGRCMWYMEEFDSCKAYFDNALRIDPEKNDTLHLDLADVLKKVGQYDEARSSYSEFIRRLEAKGQTDDAYYDRAKREIEACEIAAKLMENEPKFSVLNISYNSFLPEEEKEILNTINLKDNDFNPVFWETQTDSFLIFTTHRPKNRGNKTYSFNGQKYSDLYIARMTSDSTFGDPESMGRKVNTKANDGAACMDPSGTMMYYAICGGGKFKKFYNCSIYTSEYNPDSKKWSKYRKVDGINGKTTAVVNSRGKTKKVPCYDTQPFLSSDGNIMYFVSDREGGEGGRDIWYSQRSGSSWTEPKNCGPSVNTEFTELFPTLSKDDRTLYFTSNGHKSSYGGFDIYKSEGQLDTWTEPENLGHPLNTSYDEYSVTWFEPDSIGLFASNRKLERGYTGNINSMGHDDIWRVRKLPDCQDVKLTAHGRIRDRDSKQIIPFANVTLYKILGDNKIEPIDTFKTSQNAYYEFTLSPNTDYKIVGNAPEYLANEVLLSTKDLPKCKDTELEADVDIFLEGIEIDKPIVLQNIYYDFDKADLRPESVDELEKLIKLLNDNPSIVIQIGSHTDTNGTERYNIKLSDRRAKSVVDYLKEKGIAKSRLSAFGFGESDPMIYPELSDSDEQANRRTEFRIKSMDFQASN